MSILNKIRTKIEDVKYDYMPKLVDFMIGAANFSARRKLTDTPINILIDNSTLGHAVTHETTWVSTGTKKWGAHDVPTGYMARVPVHQFDFKSAAYENIKYLVSIAHLARKNKIRLMTSSELLNEKTYQPPGRFVGYGLYDYHLFQGIEIDSVDSIRVPEIGPMYLNTDSPREQLQAHLDTIKDPLYLSIAEKLGANFNQDAWHICTAEQHDLFCFLTMDFKLRNKIASLKEKEPFRSLVTQVMTPKELGIKLGLMPISPILLSYHNSKSPVRPELNMPENRRRNLSEYKRAQKGD